MAASARTAGRSDPAVEVGTSDWAGPLLLALRRGPSTARELAFGAGIDAAEAARRLHAMRSASLVARVDRDGSALWTIRPAGLLMAAFHRFVARNGSSLGR